MLVVYALSKIPLDFKLHHDGGISPLVVGGVAGLLASVLREEAGDDKEAYRYDDDVFDHCFPT